MATDEILSSLLYSSTALSITILPNRNSLSSSSLSIFINSPTLAIPCTIVDNCSAAPLFISVETLVVLFIFNGTIYFETNQQQDAYYHCLGLCPKPRTAIEEITFEKGWIAIDGSVEKLEHHQILSISQCRFNSNPLLFIGKLVEIRNNTHASLR
jgi:hypothetical protein